MREGVRKEKEGWKEMREGSNLSNIYNNNYKFRESPKIQRC